MVASVFIITNTMKKFLLLLIAASALLLIGCSQINNSVQITSDDSLSYDWGDINIMGGLVTHDFDFKNSGDGDVVINGAATSCMCTTAQLEFADENYSPKFGLHSNPTNWSSALKSGEEFEVLVTFDPLAHGLDATGPVTRLVYVTIEGQEDPIEIKLFGNVLSENDYEAKYGDQGTKMGDFVFDEDSYDFGVIEQSGGVVSHEFKFEYTGENPITITGVPTSCACTTASVETKQLNSGDKGSVIVEFDPNLHEEPEGKFFKTITVLTEPEQAQEVELKIWAEVNLDLGPEAYKLKEEHVD